MSELELFLGRHKAPVMWAFLGAVARALLMLLVAALAAVPLMACAVEFFGFLVIVAAGAAVTAWNER